MSKYRIKSYKEEFLEDQVKIGTEVTKDWVLFGQTPFEQLKELYSKPDFDPTTRLYCFEGEKMVGFLTGRIIKENEEKIAFFRIPLVLPGHEVEKLLLDRFIEIVREREVKKLRTVTSELWGKSLEQINKWDFEYMGDNAFLYSVRLEEIELEKIELDDIFPFNFKTDVEQMLTIFERKFGQPQEIARKNFEVLETFDKVLVHSVIRENGKIMGRSLAYLTDNKKLAIQGFLYAENEEIREKLQMQIFHVCKEAKVEELQMYFAGASIKLIDDYKKYSFEEKAKTSIYQKEIL